MYIGKQFHQSIIRFLAESVHKLKFKYNSAHIHRHRNTPITKTTGKLEAEAAIFVVESVILAYLEDACKQVEAETQTPYRRCYCHEDLPVCVGVCACVSVFLCWCVCMRFSVVVPTRTKNKKHTHT